jgi:hypothetical protein
MLTVLRIIDHEMFSIVAGPLGVIANRRNALTRTCRIPQEILGRIFLHYQRTGFSYLSTREQKGDILASLCDRALVGPCRRARLPPLARRGVSDPPAVVQHRPAPGAHLRPTHAHAL